MPISQKCELRSSDAKYHRGTFYGSREDRGAKSSRSRYGKVIGTPNARETGSRGVTRSHSGSQWEGENRKELVSKNTTVLISSYSNPTRITGGLLCGLVSY